MEKFPAGHQRGAKKRSTSTELDRLPIDGLYNLQVDVERRAGHRINTHLIHQDTKSRTLKRLQRSSYRGRKYVTGMKWDTYGDEGVVVIYMCIF
jgi:hypothetical protein